MATDRRENLRNIKTFPALVAFLRDELDWPITTDDFEEATFDYTPEELGLDPAVAVKVRTIKRLRPLTANQPWGIFFVEFEPKRLPVVALRRILNAVVTRKRTSGSRAERVTWLMDDLMFISTYGEGDERQINFAHFSQADEVGLPELKVLGWDSRDTSLHLDSVVDALSERLAWPQDADDTRAWRELWGSAFTLRHREVITTSRELAVRLAGLARAIRSRIVDALNVETRDGPLTRLMEAFREALVHDLDNETFADMYAQTIAYGLLSARITNPEGRAGSGIGFELPVTNPFLRELMEEFLYVGERPASCGGPFVDFDELGVSEVVALLDGANMEAVVDDFGDRNPDEDPVVHFYELFLAEYDAKKRLQRGVFYTPRPVVSYIVRSVDGLLRSEFGLEMGLADTATWAEMAYRHEDLEIPDGVSPGDPFVQILDPATGTGTFLVEAIDVIHQTLVAAWEADGQTEADIQGLWSAYVPSHLLPRLHGYELLMAPYAIAHLKIGLKLYETGYRFDTDERARIYLTNALEPPIDMSGQFDFAIPALAHEAQEVNAIKRDQRFSVVIGNPPYSVTSANINPFIEDLMDVYKGHVRGEQGLVALSDDYLKFIRISQHFLNQSNFGVWGMITNHGFLKGVIHRGVRSELLDQFDGLFVVDLHGDNNIGEDPPDGWSNENVFDIRQGVAVTIGVIGSESRGGRAAVLHSDVWGSRTEKYTNLTEYGPAVRSWSELDPVAPSFFLVPFDRTNQDEYMEMSSLADMMPVHSNGVKTHRDGLLIDFDKAVLTSRIMDVATGQDLKELRERYGIVDTKHWSLADAQEKIELEAIPGLVTELTYRPYDNRWIYYDPKIIEKGDSKYPTLRHMFHDNLALLTARLQPTGTFDAVFVTRLLSEMKTAESSRSSTVFPLFVYGDAASDQLDLGEVGQRPNLSPAFLTLMAKKLSLDRRGPSGLPEGIDAEDIFFYVYCVLHSPTYRTRYSEFLGIDFPRIPLTSDGELFRLMSSLGSRLVTLHLLEDVSANGALAHLSGGDDPRVEKVSYSDHVVWLDKGRTYGFHGVPENVWAFRVGGYQVCYKWLKDRQARGGKNPQPGRVLSEDDIERYREIVTAVSETIEVMGEIDDVIDAHGGWPDAFRATKGQ